jgi:hypothetical protein
MRSNLQAAVAALRADLIDADGPRISTMRNYRFAILAYDPAEEFKLRQQVNTLANDLRAHGWVVLSISLQKLLLDRIRAMGDENLAAIIERERRTAERSPERALNYLKEKLGPEIEGPDGIAADAARIISDFAAAHPDKVERTVAILGRAGALYPFFRSSALLKHLDGRTSHVPVVLLYPGERRGESGLSFMGVVDPDRDYRPRIYG